MKALSKGITAARVQRDKLGKHARRLRARVFKNTKEADRATKYWATLDDYHLKSDPSDMERSRWVADIVEELGIKSILELGTNTGRNLAVIKELHPDVRCKGLDVNEMALEHARDRGIDVEFAYQDVNTLAEPENGWDAILTMSVLDHIPDEAVEELVPKIMHGARYMIAVELWTGKHDETAAYKYTRDYPALFERHGAQTLRWEMTPGQFDTVHTPLWGYVGDLG